MDAKEMRQLTVDELKAKARQGKEEIFRARFKQPSSEAKDTSAVPKTKRDVARALTLLREKELKSIQGDKQNAV